MFVTKRIYKKDIDAINSEIGSIKKYCDKLTKAISVLCKHSNGYDYEEYGVDCYKICKVCGKTIPISFNTFIKEQDKVKVKELKKQMKDLGV